MYIKYLYGNIGNHRDAITHRYHMPPGLCAFLRVPPTICLSARLPCTRKYVPFHSPAAATHVDRTRLQGADSAPHPLDAIACARKMAAIRTEPSTVLLTMVYRLIASPVSPASVTSSQRPNGEPLCRAGRPFPYASESSCPALRLRRASPIASRRIVRTPRSPTALGPRVVRVSP